MKTEFNSPLRCLRLFSLDNWFNWGRTYLWQQKVIICFIVWLQLGSTFNYAQSIYSHIPTKIDTHSTYLFYLHGGIVQEQGLPAVSPDFGMYLYKEILNTFCSYGFQVISEVRPKGTDVSRYAKKTAKQIKGMLKAGLTPDRIVIVGASYGAYITLEVAGMVKNPKIKFALLGFCSDYSLDYYRDLRKSLNGQFLSIYEQSDKTGTCLDLLNRSNGVFTFDEVVLNMGNSHGFLYRPYLEWMLPLVNWINK